MQAVNNLLDTVREKCSIPSDNALSKKIGVTRALVSGWRVGRYPVPDERIAQLCDMAKLDGPTWVARLHVERADSRVERALWNSVLDRLSAAAAVLVLVVAATPGVARANPLPVQGVSGGHGDSMYIMFKAQQGAAALPASVGVPN
ncbi:DUF3693 domain-containing protein [Stenotrophomonas maltophilia]|uniref:DUF3693 domain-containing protein n=1 Tax=Stenotrophomonas maltophilia TaxID=40324 RepID=UPI001E378105|nr:DUF3693 domain-containing protein [Stenotrophomonas maltophilia]UGB23629.1 DUF3693 domain-containing protein [Stenotrophomonas maltophilia]